jgi:transposase-like protein
MSPRPRTPIRRTGGFRPPHCPNPRCPFHTPNPNWRYVKRGSFRRPSDQKRIQAYRCSACGRNFSHRTFSTTYWLKQRPLLAAVAAWISEGPALRQIARVLRTSHATLMRHVARLGRHCLLWHRQLVRDHWLQEPIVFDGFETFEFSQYFPFHIHLATGFDSWFFYHFTDSPLRRKGTMTDPQRTRRQQLEEQLGRPDPQAIQNDVYTLLATLARSQSPENPLILHSDDHRAYRQSIRQLRCTVATGLRIEHHVTSGQARRTKRNPLFPVNLADLLARHGNANHRRETIAFSKRRQAALERMAVLMVWRNVIKRRCENGPPESAAMRLGLTDRLLGWRDVLRKRLFPQHINLPKEWARYYGREVKTPILGDRQAVHQPTFAF